MWQVSQYISHIWTLGIKHVTMSAAHSMTMQDNDDNPQLNYIYWVGHLAKSVNKIATFIYHGMTIYVPGRNIPLKFHTYARYANYFMCIYETTVLAY